jgi:ubiquinone/menaquinone biosynthesis C-methylase UbiE
MSTATATAIQDAAVPLPVLAGRLITGYASAQLVFAAAALRLGDHLAAAPQTAAQLAEATGARADLLERVLRGLAVIGVVSVDPPDRYRLTPLGACVCGTGPFSMRDLVLCGEESYRSWSELLPSLTSGETPFVAAYGTSRWDYLRSHPDRARSFHRAMAGMARSIAAQIMQCVDLAGARTIVDVGGGSGGVMAELLSANPALQGVIVDTPSGIAGAAEQLQARSLAERCRLVEGNFLEEIPGGGDAYVLSHVLHNWDDAGALKILQNCGRAAQAGARLVVAEPVMSPELAATPAGYHAVMMDLQMLVMTGGRQRSAAEHEALFESAGFQLIRISRGNGPDCIVEGRRD